MSIPTNAAINAHINQQIFGPGDVPRDHFEGTSVLSKVNNQVIAISETRAEELKTDPEDQQQYRKTDREYSVMYPMVDSADLSQAGWVSRAEVPIEVWFAKHKDSISPILTKIKHTTIEKQGKDPVRTREMIHETSWNVAARAQAAYAVVASAIQYIQELCWSVAYKVAQTASNTFNLGIDFSGDIQKFEDRKNAMWESITCSLVAVKDPVSVISMVSTALQNNETPRFLAKQDTLAENWGTVFQPGQQDVPAT